MRVLIIEDEYLNYKELSFLLKRIDSSIIIDGPISTLVELDEVFRKGNSQYDVILSDICLADGDVFSAFSKIILDVPVIFTTAYDEYAIKAFDFNGIAYLLKPVSEKALRNALSRASGQIFNERQLAMLKNIFFSKRDSYRENFMVSHADFCEIVSIKEVNHIFSENGITYLVLNSGKRVVVNHTLYELETELNPKDFFRANRQYIVKKGHIKRLYNCFNRKTQLQLDIDDDMRIEVSREKTIQLKTWMDI